MKNSIHLNKLTKELAFCKDHWTILYGSVLSEKYIVDRSDVDVAIITQKKDKKTNLAIWRTLLEFVPKNCDLRIFELLPLYIKIDIIQNYQVIFGNPLEISEYFYYYRTF